MSAEFEKINAEAKYWYSEYTWAFNPTIYALDMRMIGNELKKAKKLLAKAEERHDTENQRYETLQIGRLLLGMSRTKATAYRRTSSLVKAAAQHFHENELAYRAIAVEDARKAGIELNLESLSG